MAKTFVPAPVPVHEKRRLATLRQYQLLDTPGEELFDAFTRLAAQICGTPMSLITLVDEDRQWFKSNVGLPGVTQTSREVAFCAHAILEDGIFEIPDARADERFANNPLVLGEPKIRFYAGVSLVTSDGDALGTLCVIDHKPRRLTIEQRASLRSIADVLLEQFEMRRVILRLFDSSQTELYHFDLTARHVVFASEAARPQPRLRLAGAERLAERTAAAGARADRAVRGTSGRIASGSAAARDVSNDCAPEKRHGVSHRTARRTNSNACQHDRARVRDRPHGVRIGQRADRIVVGCDRSGAGANPRAPRAKPGKGSA